MDLNVNSDTTGYNVSPAAPHPLFIGSWQDEGYNFLGSMSELIIYDGILDPADIMAVETYLAARIANDDDGDGVPDDQDECPDSDLSETVIIDSCDSGVGNILVENGCSISDLINQCADGAESHGKFVSCVSRVTNGLKTGGYISGKEKGYIQSCAGQADVF